MSSSFWSGSLKPPRAKNLMPLSGIGLCEAEITAPISTLSTLVRKATPGVGMIPASITSNPPALMPAARACERKSPETRVSRPISARCRFVSRPPSSPSTRTAASPKSKANWAVRSRLASPRTPSVPNIRGIYILYSISRIPIFRSSLRHQCPFHRASFVMDELYPCAQVCVCRLWHTLMRYIRANMILFVSSPCPSI